MSIILATASSLNSDSDIGPYLQVHTRHTNHHRCAAHPLYQLTMISRC